MDTLLDLLLNLTELVHSENERGGDVRLSFEKDEIEVWVYNHDELSHAYKKIGELTTESLYAATDFVLTMTQGGK